MDDAGIAAWMLLSRRRVSREAATRCRAKHAPLKPQIYILHVAIIGTYVESA
jgi:hypothetical protein